MNFDENAVITSYFNPAKLIYEIWIVEGYHNKIENSIIEM